MADANPASTDPDALEARRQTLFGALEAARADGTLTSDQRRAAIVAAMRHNLTSGAPGSMPLSEVQLAVQQALRDLPSGATREQKLAAIRAAIQSVPSASQFVALLDHQVAGQKTGSHEGLGAGLAGALLEGVLDTLLGGGQ
jgi:hypothetical protein